MLNFFGKRSVSFKCTADMHKAIEYIMERYNIDRSSVIRLALFDFINFVESPQGQRMTISEIITHLESQSPPPGRKFSDFCK